MASPQDHFGLFIFGYIDGANTAQPQNPLQTAPSWLGASIILYDGHSR